MSNNSDSYFFRSDIVYNGFKPKDGNKGAKNPVVEYDRESDEFCDMITDIVHYDENKRKNNWHECFKGEVCPYFDFDGSFDSRTHDIKKVTDRFNHMCLAIMHEIFAKEKPGKLSLYQHQQRLPGSNIDTNDIVFNNNDYAEEELFDDDEFAYYEGVDNYINSRYKMSISHGQIEPKDNGHNHKLSVRILIRTRGKYSCGAAFKHRYLEKAVKIFNREFKQAFGTAQTIKAGIDEGCYRSEGSQQLMRVIGCFKAEDKFKRILQPVQYVNGELKTLDVEDVFEDFLIQNVRNEELVKYDYKRVIHEKAEADRKINKIRATKPGALKPEEPVNKAIVDGFIDANEKQDSKWETRESPSLIVYNGNNENDEVFNLLTDQMKQPDWMPNCGRAKEIEKNDLKIITFGSTMHDKCMISGDRHQSNHPFISVHNFDGKYRAYYKCPSEKCAGVRILMMAPKCFSVKKIADIKAPCTFDFDDEYDYLRFYLEFNQYEFKSKVDLIQTMNDIYPKVIVKVLDQKGFYIKKGSDAESLYTTMDHLSNTDFEMFYWESGKKEPKKHMMTIKDFMDKHTKPFAKVSCKLNPEEIPPFNFNTWVPIVAKRVDSPDDETKEGLEILLKYIKDVISDNNMINYNYVISWIKGLVDMKQKLNRASLVLVSETQGTGKSTLADFISSYLLRGDVHVYKSNGIESVVEQFTKQLEGKRLILIEEVSSQQKDFVANFTMLKTLITDYRINIHEKTKTRYNTDNIGNYLINTNHRSSIYLEQSDRRHMILDVSQKHVNDRAYFTNLRNMAFNQDVGDAFYTYLMDYKDCVDVSIVPETGIKADIQDSSKSNSQLFLDAMLFASNNPETDNSKERTIEDILNDREQKQNDDDFVDIEDDGPSHHITSNMRIHADKHRVIPAIMYELYSEWCKENNFKPITGPKFSKFMCSKLKKCSSNGKKYYKLQ